MNKTNVIIPIFIGENSCFLLIMELLLLYQKLLVANVNNLKMSWVKGGFNLLSQIPHEVLSGCSCPEGEPQPGLRLSPLFLSAVFSPAGEQLSLVYVIQTRKPGLVIFTFWPNCLDHLSRERLCVEWLRFSFWACFRSPVADQGEVTGAGEERLGRQVTYHCCELFMSSCHLSFTIILREVLA